MGNCFKSSKTKPHNLTDRYIQSQLTGFDLKQKYIINFKAIGSGSYGKVFSAVDINDWTIRVAIKIINKTGITTE